MREVFKAVDLDNNGRISFSELQFAFLKLDINIDEGEVKRIFEKVDSSHIGELDYSEFLYAAMDFSMNIDKEHLIRTFSYFDLDNTGYITPNNVRTILLRAGKEIAYNEDIENIMKEINPYKKIWLDDFLGLFDICI